MSQCRLVQGVIFAVVSFRLSTRLHTLSTMAPRFKVYVKAASDGKSLGDCPFSQRVNMNAHLKIPAHQFTLIPVDITNKPPEFLKLNPDGTVPVLEDTDKNAVIADSAKIIAYINELFPQPDLKQNYDGPAVAASSGIFPKLAAFLKNKDPAASPALRGALEAELAKLDSYLQSAEHQGKYLLGDNICELDCNVLPKLKHVQVAGNYFQKFQIPEKLTALQEYIKAGQASEVFQQTAYPDEEIIKGWSRHGLVKVD